MVPFIVIVIGVILLPMILVIAMFNSLVTVRNMCKESWSNIDTELKRRYDLIPNLVETVRGYANHERGLLERVTQCRSRAIQSTGSPESQARDENELVRELRTLFAVVENYPELKASDNFLELQRELTRTEDRIQAARRFYNGNVRDLNNKVQVFPSNIIANMFGFKQGEYFEVEQVAMIKPDVDI